MEGDGPGPTAARARRDRPQALPWLTRLVCVRVCARRTQSARVAIKVSDRSSMDPTTKEREVSISGPYSNVKLAEAMVAEKLAQNKARGASSSNSASNGNHHHHHSAAGSARGDRDDALAHGADGH